MIVPAARPAHIASLGAPIALKKAEAVVVSDVVTRDEGIGRRHARYETALGLIAQHRHKLRAIVGLAAQRLVRDNDRGSRQSGRRDAIEHILRDSYAVERVFGALRVVDPACPAAAALV